MRSILLTAALAALGPAGALAQNGTAATGWIPTLEIRGVQALSEGSALVLGERKLVKGEPASVTIWTGRSLCALGIGAEPTATFGDPANVWRMNSDYLGERNGRHEVRVTSGFSRLSDSAAGTTTTQTFSLQEGDRIVLDALSEPVSPACSVHVVTFEARLALQPTNPALARATYTADMWLVHTGPDGKEQREHLVMNVDGSTVVPFMFNRLAFPIPQVDPRQGNAEAVIQLTGALRARPRADGVVDLDVETSRLVFGLDNPDAPFRSSPTTVRKTLTLKADETTAIDFPPPSRGFSVIALERDGKTHRFRAKPDAVKVTPGTGKKDFELRESIEVKDGKLYLYTNKFFGGHKTQLLITLKPLR
jgi:hypothetical protein